MPDRTREPFVRVQHVDKDYPDREHSTLWQQVVKPVLKDVSIELRKGAVTGLLGGSGSGKSTLSRLLLGLEAPDRGNILVEGRPHASWHKNNRGKIAAVFQDYTTSVNPLFTVEECIAEGSLILGKGRKEAKERAVQLMEQTGLPKELRHRRCLELSGGQIQRICLARAVASAPSLLILDEAVSALDASVQAEVIRLLMELRGDMTCLFITHDIQLASLVCEDIIVLHNGRVTDMLPARRLADGNREGISEPLRSLLDCTIVFRTDFVSRASDSLRGREQ